MAVFTMTVEEQLNIANRTLVLGVPTYDVIPSKIVVLGKALKVVGVSCGCRPPYMSLEIEKTDSNIVGETITDI